METQLHHLRKLTCPTLIIHQPISLLNLLIYNTRLGNQTTQLMYQMPTEVLVVVVVVHNNRNLLTFATSYHSYSLLLTIHANFSLTEGTRFIRWRVYDTKPPVVFTYSYLTPHDFSYPYPTHIHP